MLYAHVCYITTTTRAIISLGISNVITHPACVVLAAAAAALVVVVGHVYTHMPYTHTHMDGHAHESYRDCTEVG